MKKTVGYMMICILFACAISGIYFGVRFTIINNQLQSVSEYIETIKEKDKTISQLKQEQYELLLNYKNEKEENDARKEYVVTLLETVSALEEEKETLSLLFENSEFGNAEKSELLEQLNFQISKLQEKIEELNILIILKDEQIFNLSNEVTKLNDLIAGYEDIKNGTSEVVFYIKDIYYSAKVVKNGDCVTGLNVPLETNAYIFNFWTIDGITEIDVNSYAITEDIIFYANITSKYEVIFTSDEQIIDVQYVIAGQYAQAVNEPIKEDYSFGGWYLDGYIVSDITLWTVNKNLTFVARWTGLEKNGLYDTTTGAKIKTWAEMLSEDYLKVSSSNVLTAGSKMKQIDGDLYIPNGIVSIGQNCFVACIGLRRIKLPDSVTKIDFCSFAGCTGLKSIYLPVSVEDVLTMNFWNANYNPFVSCSSSLVIYCGATSKPSGYLNTWNNYASGKGLTVKYGYTYTEYFVDVKFNGIY